VRTPHHIVLVDSCIGNDKVRPTRPEWNLKRDENFMRALAAAGRLSALDPGDELRHELHYGRRIAVDGLPARAMVETWNHVQAAERLRGRQASRLADHCAVVVDAREWRNRLVRPAMINNNLSAVSAKGVQIGVGSIVDARPVAGAGRAWQQ
jgi:hypothetical protein